jgi:4-amino-4-deoxy-L-arabinose transferase-like glycosyltransferase
VSTSDSRRDVLWLAALLALLLVVGLLRPLLPIDETRYASVAWEMWTRGDFLVPFRNGEPYAHKPPLLFWLMHAGWALFGVNDWWPRLISPLFAAGTLWVCHRLARLVWPDRPVVAQMAPFILLSCFLYAYFASALMFDAMIAFFVALGWLGLVVAWKTGAGRGGFVLLSLAMGGALFAKGPVALVHLLPLALLAPWWMREQRPPWRRWYLGVLCALLGGAALILAWAVPAAIAGGEAYRNAIFWGQTANRMVSSFAHRAPWWFYLAYLPLMLAPWLLWPRWWRGLQRGLLGESGFRFALLGALFCLLFFSLVSGKRWHYLLPEFVLFALLASRALADSRATRLSMWIPGLGLAAVGIGAIFAAPRLAARLGGLDDASALNWGGAVAVAAGLGLLLLRPSDALTDVRRIASATLITVSALLAAADVAMREPYDVSVVAAKLALFQREGRPVAIEGEYHGQWHLAGRLTTPLTELPAKDVPGWLAQHPQGRVIYTLRKAETPPPGAKVEYQRRYRGEQLLILAAP